MPDNVSFVLELVKGGKRYPTVFLPKAYMLPPNAREAYVECLDGCQPSTARVFMTESMRVALPSNVFFGAVPVGIAMGGVSRDETNIAATEAMRTLSFGEVFYIVKASVFDAMADGESVYEILLSTQQYFWKFKIAESNYDYNLLFPDKKFFITGAVNPSEPYTYQDLVNRIESDLGVALGDLPFTPVAFPIDFIASGLPLTNALTRICRTLGIQLVFDVFQNTFAFKRLIFTDPDGDFAKLNLVSQRASFQGTANGSGDQAAQNFTPDNIQVWFPRFPIPTGTSSEDRFTIIHTIEFTPVIDDSDIIRAEAWDVVNPAYTQNLNDLANERRDIYANRLLIDHRIYVFAGGFKFLPSSVIRSVRWTMDIMEFSGWQTTVCTHGMADNREGMAFDQIKAAMFPEHPGNQAQHNVHTRDDGTTSIGPADNIWRFVFVEQFDDYITANPKLGDEVVGQLVKIALPYDLQKTPFDGQTIDGETFAYTGIGERTVTGGKFAGTQTIQQRYVAGCEITASIPVGGTGVSIPADTEDGVADPVVWQDDNRGARIWLTTDGQVILHAKVKVPWDHVEGPKWVICTPCYENGIPLVNPESGEANPPSDAGGAGTDNPCGTDPPSFPDADGNCANLPDGSEGPEVALYIGHSITNKIRLGLSHIGFAKVGQVLAYLPDGEWTDPDDDEHVLPAGAMLPTFPIKFYGKVIEYTPNTNYCKITVVSPAGTDLGADSAGYKCWLTTPHEGELKGYTLGIGQLIYCDNPIVNADGGLECEALNILTPGDHKVMVTGDDPTAGYLHEKVEGDDKWVATEVDQNNKDEGFKERFKHIYNATEDDIDPDLQMSVGSPGFNKENKAIEFGSSVMKFDITHHYFGPGDSMDGTQIVADQKWIELVDVTPEAESEEPAPATKIQINHMKANPENASSKYKTGEPSFLLNTLALSFPVVVLDEAGHTVQQGADFLTVYLSGDGIWTTVVHDEEDPYRATLKHDGPDVAKVGGTPVEYEPIDEAVVVGSNLVLKLNHWQVDARGHSFGYVVGTGADITISLEAEDFYSKVWIDGTTLKGRKRRGYWLKIDAGYTDEDIVGECP